MAERSEDESDLEECSSKPNESLYHEIKKLEKQKMELERKNSERQMLENQLKSLQKNVASLKKSASSASPSKNKISRTPRAARSYLGEHVSTRLPTLSESRSQFRAIRSELGGASVAISAGSSESSELSEDEKEYEGSSLMSEVHKQKLQDHLGELVDNMDADDIFNDLIANKILTTSDVNRIKEKNTKEAINRELVESLTRKSEKAFHVFVRSLSRTLQEHLAKLLEDPPRRSKKKKKRKRKAGELGMSVDVQEILPSSRKKPTCSCQEVEEQILNMAKNAYGNIRRRDETPAAFEQFRKELSQTNEVIRDSMEIMNTLKVLCKHDTTLQEITYGSVTFVFKFRSIIALKNLWMMYVNGSLLNLMQTGFITKELKHHCHAKEITLQVRIAEMEYLKCLRELERLKACDNSKVQFLRSSHKRKCKAADHPTLVKSACENQTGALTVPVRQGSTSAILACENHTGAVTVPVRLGPRTAFREIHKNVVMEPNNTTGRFGSMQDSTTNGKFENGKHLYPPVKRKSTELDSENVWVLEDTGIQKCKRGRVCDFRVKTSYHVWLRSRDERCNNCRDMKYKRKMFF